MNAHAHSEKCRQFLGSLSEYIDGELQAELCQQLEEHLHGCENCRVVVNTLRKTIELYEQVTPSPDLPEGVRERLFARLQLEDNLQPRA